MQNNFFMRVGSIWPVSFNWLMTNVWSWLFFGIVQVFCFAGGLFGIFLGVLHFVGLESVIVCQQFFEQAADKSYGALTVQQCSEVFSWIDSFPVALLVFLMGSLLFVYGIWLNFGVTTTAHALYRDQAFSFSTIFSVDWSFFIKVLGATLLMILVSLPAFFLFIVPGIILTIRLVAVFPLLSDDHGLSVVQAFKKSWDLTRKSWRQVIWFFIGFFAIHLAVASFLQPIFALLLFPLARYVLVQELPDGEQTQRSIEDAVELKGTL